MDEQVRASGIREIHLKTIADVLAYLRPGDDEDTIFQREAAEAHIRELQLLASEAQGKLTGEVLGELAVKHFKTKEGPISQNEQGTWTIAEFDWDGLAKELNITAPSSERELSLGYWREKLQAAEQRIIALESPAPSSEHRIETSPDSAGVKGES